MDTKGTTTNFVEVVETGWGCDQWRPVHQKGDDTGAHMKGEIEIFQAEKKKKNEHTRKKKQKAQMGNILECPKA